ncbi:UNVERIFIED_CONTAM: hypothetical protein FKN15_072414 [Acipenser sinensis]
MNPNCLRSVDSSNSSPLHDAAGGGRIQLIKEIVNTTGSDGLNVTDNKGNTPLHLAVKYKQSESCRTLLELGADPNILNANQISALHMAVNLRHNDIVEVLLSHSSVNMNLEGDLGNTPVMLACSIDNHEALNLLAREEIGHQIERHINYVDKSGSTPLHLAVQGGNTEVIKLCISNGAKIDLQQGANIDSLDCESHSPLLLATTCGAWLTVELLIQKGANVKLKDSCGCNFLHLAVEQPKGLKNISEDILQRKDVRELLNDEDNEGCIPLHYACRLGIQESVTNMLGLKNTALHLAAREGHASSVSLLLSKGAEISLNKSEASFFHEAIHQGRKEVAFVVIESERCHEAITMFKLGSTKRAPKLEMIEFLPESFKLLLDRSMKESEDDVSSQDYCIEYNFQYLQCPMKNKKLSQEDTLFKCKPLISLNVSSHSNMEMLAYGLKAHVLNLAIYSLGLVPLTILIVNLRPEISVNKTADNGTEVREVTITEALDKHSYFYAACMILVIVMNLYAIGKEMVQIYQQRWRYLLDYTNSLDWCVAVSSLLFAIPLLCNSQEHWPWQCGAIAVFHSWVNFLLYMQRPTMQPPQSYSVGGQRSSGQLTGKPAGARPDYRGCWCAVNQGHPGRPKPPGSSRPWFERFGIYVVMFGEILRTLVCIILLFFFLNLAFALAFYALMLEQIGLAVGDIAEIQRNACLKRIAMQFPAFWNGKPESTTRLNTGHCQSTPLEAEVQIQKYRLKDISMILGKQHNLLKLIIQKMEIVSEADEQDDTELFQYGNVKRQQQLHNKSKWNYLIKAVHDKQQKSL